MALTLVVVSSPEALSLSFDMPRLVIGRGDGCDMRLPDPSVSHRHCSIRQRGAEYVVLDEGSLNGTFYAKSKLSPQSPQVVRTGDLLRIGRVWLEVRIEAAIVPQSQAAAAKELALRLVTAGLASQGEDARPRVLVTEGPDRGRELRLAEPGRRYTLGRAKDVDLPLTDENASRRHIDIELRGDHVMVRDLGSKAGAHIDDALVGEGGTPWRPGQILALGDSKLTLEHAAIEALGELERCPDERIAGGERFEPPVRAEPTPPPPPADASNAETPTPEPGSAGASSRPADLAAAPEEPLASTRTFGLTDGLVILLALGVLAASVAGLLLLLRG